MALYKVAQSLPIFELLIALDDSEKQPSLYDHAPAPRCNDVGTQTHQQVATLQRYIKMVWALGAVVVVLALVTGFLMAGACGSRRSEKLDVAMSKKLDKPVPTNMQLTFRDELVDNMSVVESVAFLKHLGFDIGSSRITKDVLHRIILLMKPSAKDVMAFRNTPPG